MAEKMRGGPAAPVRALDHAGATSTNIPTAELERGKSLDEFLDQFPTVSRAKAVAIREAAKQGVTAQASAE